VQKTFFHTSALRPDDSGQGTAVRKKIVVKLDFLLHTAYNISSPLQEIGHVIVARVSVGYRSRTPTPS
jgi:hypothetical protein